MSYFHLSFRGMKGGSLSSCVDIAAGSESSKAGDSPVQCQRKGFPRPLNDGLLDIIRRLCQHLVDLSSTTPKGKTTNNITLWCTFKKAVCPGKQASRKCRFRTLSHNSWPWGRLLSIALSLSLSSYWREIVMLGLFSSSRDLSRSINSPLLVIWTASRSSKIPKFKVLQIANFHH